MDLRLSIELNEIVIETYDFGDGLLETKEGAPERIGIINHIIFFSFFKINKKNKL